MIFLENYLDSEPLLTTNCSQGDIRLVGGTILSSDGRLEFCNNDEWGTVCDDLWEYNNTTNAQVVCRLLGFNTSGTFN